MPNMGSMPEMAGNADASQGEPAEKSIVDQAKAFFDQAVTYVKDWLYEGVNVQSAQQVAGSLVPVEIGMQNDDYAEILSGLEEGDVVLYTASEESSSFNMFGGMGGMGGMMGGRR